MKNEDCNKVTDERRLIERNASACKGLSDEQFDKIVTIKTHFKPTPIFKVQVTKYIDGKWQFVDI